MIDCGLGNVHSLLSAIAHLAPADQTILTSDPAVIETANAVLFPGDGAFGYCMAEIERRQLREPLIAAAQTKPFFAICVGMQVLFESSEEAPEEAGLGILPGKIYKFSQSKTGKVPLMGWLDVQITKPELSLFEGIERLPRFYFLHSYYLPADNSATVMSANYQTKFAAMVTKQNLIATQFHPEKSHQLGLQLLKNFLNTVAN